MVCAIMAVFTVVVKVLLHGGLKMMKNFYYELLTSTLNPEFNPKDYLGHEEAINELINNLNISVDETQELIAKIERIGNYQNEKIAEIEAYKQIDYVRLVICAVTVATVSYLACSVTDISPMVSFIVSMIIMSVALFVNMLAVRFIGNVLEEQSLSRGAFAEHALNTLYAKRQQKEFFTRSDNVYSRADFDRLLEKNQQLIVARSI